MATFVVGNQSGLSLGVAGRIPVQPLPTDIPQKPPHLLIKSDPLPSAAPSQEPPKQVGPQSTFDQLVHKAADFAAKTGITTGAELATGIFGSKIVPVKTGLSTRPGPFSIPKLGVTPFAKKVVLGTPGGIALEQMAVSDSGDEDNVAVRPEVMEAKAAAFAAEKRRLLLAQTPPMWLADP